jgi:hypothetical protein
MDRKARLAAKVKAQNRANQFANELYPKLVKVFEPFIGQKVLKADGTVLAKIQSQFPELPSTPGLHVYPGHSNYSLRWIVRTSEQESDYTCLYAESTLYVGDMKNAILASLYPPVHYRTDYTVEEIESLREAYVLAKRAADNAFSALHPFGENDN